MDVFMDLEKKGLCWVGILFVIVCVILVFMVVLENGILCYLEIGEVVGFLFFKGIVVFIFIIFVIFGFVYGKVIKLMKNDKDVIDVMFKSMGVMGFYIMLVFFVV